MSIFKTAKQLSPVSSAAANEYDQQQDVIQIAVKQALVKNRSLHEFMGNSPLKNLVDNYRHHTLFMSSIFQLNNYTLLARMMVWMYRVYHAQGFEYNYFVTAFSEWRKAVILHMSPVNAAEIDGVYQWVVEQHVEFIQLAESADYQVFPNEPGRDVSSAFLLHLLQGDYQACLAIGKTYMDDGHDLAFFYVEVIEPSMVEMGRLWETGHISVAQEHLATAVVSRVMFALFTSTGLLKITSPKAVIAAAPSELHEIGARMIADLLEQQGWGIDYLGANVPQEDLLEYLRVTRPCFLGLSVVMPLNLAATREIIAAIRRDISIAGIKIMVGGAGFKHSEELWRQVGADDYAVDGYAAIEISQRWWKQQAR